MNKILMQAFLVYNINQSMDQSRVSVPDLYWAKPAWKYKSTNYGENEEPQFSVCRATKFVVLPRKRAKPQNLDFYAEIVLFPENILN